METMGDVNNTLLQEQLDRKKQRRRELAQLPWPEKVRIVVELQKIAYPLVKDRNPRACIWNLPELSPR